MPIYSTRADDAEDAWWANLVVPDALNPEPVIAAGLADPAIRAKVLDALGEPPLKDAGYTGGVPNAVLGKQWWNAARNLIVRLQGSGVVSTTGSMRRSPPLLCSRCHKATGLMVGFPPACTNGCPDAP